MYMYVYVYMYLYLWNLDNHWMVDWLKSRVFFPPFFGETQLIGMGFQGTSARSLIGRFSHETSPIKCWVYQEKYSENSDVILKACWPFPQEIIILFHWWIHNKHEIPKNAHGAQLENLHSPMSPWWSMACLVDWRFLVQWEVNKNHKATWQSERLGILVVYLVVSANTRKANVSVFSQRTNGEIPADHGWRKGHRLVSSVAEWPVTPFHWLLGFNPSEKYEAISQLGLPNSLWKSQKNMFQSPPDATD